MAIGTAVDDQNFAQEFRTAAFTFLRAIGSRDISFLVYRFVQPAGFREIEELESRLGHRLPTSLRRLFLSVASQFELVWALDNPPSDLETSIPFQSGYIRWDIDRVADLCERKLQTECDTVLEPFWKDKIPFINFGNGDYLAVSKDEEYANQVFYLTAADPPNCVVSFNGDLFSFLLEWCRIGGIFEESLLQFRNEQTAKIDISRPDAVAWFSWLGL